MPEQPTPAQSPQEQTLHEQVALVTGAGRGIGREIAVALAREGMRVGLVGRTPSTLTEAATACTAAGAAAVSVCPADVTDGEAVRQAVATVVEQLGSVDLLVGNAGVREDTPARPWETDPDDWWRVLETNLRGVLLLDSAVLPAMVDRAAGRVLHVGSGMGQRPRPRGEWSAYAVSKAGLSRLTDSLAAALDGTGVTVLEMSPGLVRTDMTETMWGPAGEQAWSPVDAMTEAVVRFARGDLDALHGRFVHAARDDLDGLLAVAEEIRGRDARTLRLRPYGPADPLG